jgi:hypothetical protein
MGFFKDKANDVTEALASGDADSAAQAAVHAMFEGGGSLADNLAALTDAVNEENGR